jgi:hypothetical protein
MQLQTAAKTNYAEVGEAISHELAAKMIKDFNDANPSHQYCFHIGRNVIEQVLAQPGCVGMRIYRAVNEKGRETLVYAGIDSNGKTIFEYSGVNKDGKLGEVEGLIGDRGGFDIIW